MDIFSLFMICGGLAFFLFGMNIMSDNLKKVAGGKLQGTLKKLTDNPMKSLALGAAITIAIQSSSALTVMLVGLVNSGIMELSQTVGVIMGSDIGTTLTAWILSLSGIRSDNVFLSLLKPENFAPVVGLIGVIMVMASKSQKRKDLGTILCGFAVLMYGMTMMSNAVEPVAQMPQFQKLLVAFDNPIAGLLIGTAFTGVIQSSAASIGVLQALALTGSIRFGMVVPIVIGANIGTCVTALLSAIGVSRKAKRVPAIHVGIKIIGAVVWMILYMILRYPVGAAIFDKISTPFEIALFHTIFNLGTIFLLLPFQKQLVRGALKLLPGDDDEESAEPAVLLDKRLLLSPGLAVRTCREKAVEMARYAREAFTKSMDIFSSYSKETVAEIIKIEQHLDYLEDELDSFLISLSGRDLSDKDMSLVSEMMHCVTDFERISDHAANMTDIAKRMKKGKLTFSEDAQKELFVMKKAIEEIMDLMVVCFEQDDRNLAQKIEPLEEVIDGLTKEVKNRHIDRLQTGICSGEMGVILNDILTNCERVSDHCSNVGVCIVQSENASFETHSYIRELEEGQEPVFVGAYSQYQEKYQLAPRADLKKKKKKNKDGKEKEKKKLKTEETAPEKAPREKKDKSGEPKEKTGGKSGGQGKKEKNADKAKSSVKKEKTAAREKKTGAETADGPETEEAVISGIATEQTEEQD